jgi:hypothetical protein
MDQSAPKTLVEAFYGIRCNRMVEAILSHPWWIGCLIYVFAFFLGLLAPDYLCVILALPGFLLLAVLGYFAAAWTFVAGVRSRRPRCPSCKEVTWQLQCGYCHQPVPILALLYRGAFLRHCPVCDASLSNLDGTLLARCRNCGKTVPGAHTHLGRPSVIEVELGNELPEPPAGWQDKASRPDYQELHRGDTRAYTIVYRVTHEPASIECIPDRLFELFSQVWIGHAVNSLVRARIIGSIPITTRKRMSLLFEDASVPGDLNPHEFRAVRTATARLDRRACPTTRLHGEDRGHG